MADVELHLHATYHVQHPALKSDFEKSQSVMDGKLFFSNMTVSELTQSFPDTKTSDLNCLYEAVVQKKALTIRHIS